MSFEFECESIRKFNWMKFTDSTFVLRSPIEMRNPIMSAAIKLCDFARVSRWNNMVEPGIWFGAVMANRRYNEMQSSEIEQKRGRNKNEMNRWQCCIGRSAMPLTNLLFISNWRYFLFSVASSLPSRRYFQNNHSLTRSLFGFFKLRFFLSLALFWASDIPLWTEDAHCVKCEKKISTSVAIQLLWRTLFYFSCDSLNVCVEWCATSGHLIEIEQMKII